MSTYAAFAIDGPAFEPAPVLTFLEAPVRDEGGRTVDGVPLDAMSISAS
jgi:hypothetical protein